MKLPRVRFTVRRMTVAVAIAAVVIETWQLWMWSCVYHHFAEQASASETEFRQAIVERREIRGCLRPPPGEPPPSATRLAKLKEWETHYSLLKRKYQYASSHPWVPIGPEPQSPNP
jgi:hypothetical protein